MKLTSRLSSNGIKEAHGRIDEFKGCSTATVEDDGDDDGSLMTVIWKMQMIKIMVTMDSEWISSGGGDKPSN